MLSVGERFVIKRSINENKYGWYESENAGLSNENIGENPMPQKPKVSYARFVHIGLVST